MNNNVPETESEDELRKRFLKVLTSFFRGGTYDNILLGLIERFISNFKKAQESSDKLTTALNNLTFFGTIIAAVSLIVASLALGLEAYRTFVMHI